MSNRSLTILGVVAAAMLAWAIVQSHWSRRPGGESGGVRPLIQGLLPADIHSIVIGQGKETVTLRREGEGFVLVNRDNYPAANREINRIITDCLDMTVGRRVTGDAGNHAELEVTEEKARTVVKFLRVPAQADQPGELIAGVLIGKSAGEGGGAHVRLANSNDVYVCENVPWFSTSALSWVDQQLLNVSREQLARVKVQGPQESYTLEGEPNNVVRVAEAPAGRQSQSSACEQAFTALGGLRFNDVQRQSERTESPVFDRRYIGELKDGTVYTCELGSRADKYYLKCGVKFLGPTEVRVGQGESAEQLKAKEAQLKAGEAAQRFAQRHQGWVYEISKWQYDRMTKPLNDLLEKPQSAPVPAGSSAGSGGPGAAGAEPNQPLRAGGGGSAEPVE